MSGSKRAKRRWLLAAVYLGAGLVFGAVYWGIRILSGDSEADLDGLLTSGATGLIFAGALPIFLAVSGRVTKRRERRSPSYALGGRVQAAVQKGTLPDDADPESWSAELRRRQRVDRIGLTISVVVGAAFVVLAVWLTLHPQEGASPWFGVVLLVVIVLGFGLAVRSELRQWRTRKRFIGELEREMRRRAADAGRADDLDPVIAWSSDTVGLDD